MTLDDWVRTLCADLGLDPGEVDVKAVLDLARDAAHAVERPAAPVTTFLAGYAAGRAGGGASQLAAAIAQATAATRTVAAKDD